VRLLAYVTGSVNQELLLRNEYLTAENRILRTKLPALLRLSDPGARYTGGIGKRAGRKALREIACIANGQVRRKLPSATRTEPRCRSTGCRGLAPDG
jgi:hypothetical protein